MLLFFVATAAALGLRSPLNFFASEPLLVVASALPFPQWLTDFTGLREWPGLEPPYIPLDFVRLNFIPEPAYLVHEQGDCLSQNNNPNFCSFDCFNCVASDDIYTCPQLSQTFDDGPLPLTPTLTKLLTCKTTFFTIGVNVVRYPQIYADTADKGHIMGCHTWSHRFLPGLTNEEIVAQIEWAVWAMNATYGHLPKWFRPPYGGIDNRVRAIVRLFGMQAVLWDYDTSDWRLSEDPTRLDGDVYAGVAEFARKTSNRGLILEHDTVDRTVNLGIHLHRQLGPNQLTVPQCVGGIDYLKTFPRPQW